MHKQINTPCLVCGEPGKVSLVTQSVMVIPKFGKYLDTIIELMPVICRKCFYRSKFPVAYAKWLTGRLLLADELHPQGRKTQQAISLRSVDTGEKAKVFCGWLRIAHLQQFDDVIDCPNKLKRESVEDVRGLPRSRRVGDVVYRQVRGSREIDYSNR